MGEPKKANGDRYIERKKENEPTKATTVVLLDRHYNFLQAVRYYETTTLGKSVNMSDVLNDALELYREHYQKKHSITINERGKVIEAK